MINSILNNNTLYKRMSTILMKQPDLQQTSQHQPTVKTMDKMVISFLNSAQQVGNNKVNMQDNPLYFSLSEH